MHDYYKNNNEHIKYDVSQNNKVAIIWIGSPFGKSTFCENNLTYKGYVRINQDTLKIREKVIKSLEENLKQGKKVVIDRISPKKKEKKIILKFAKNTDTMLEDLIFQCQKT